LLYNFFNFNNRQHFAASAGLVFSSIFQYRKDFMSEAEIITGCLKNNRKHQEMLYDRYAAVMYAICIRYTHNRDNALDILQDGFVKVFDRMSSFQGAGSFEGWMKKIFIHTAINYYHKVRHLSEHFQDTTEIPINISDQADAISKLSEKEILELIAALPDGYRIVFNLYVIEGYDHEEIAQLLGIASSTSRSQLLKARRVLQQKLKEKKIIAA
jgi:RNA polymerase sigma factor (sigma-70 family)